jgi:hypothetical protein
MSSAVILNTDAYLCHLLNTCILYFCSTCYYGIAGLEFRVPRTVNNNKALSNATAVYEIIHVSLGDLKVNDN